MNFKIVTDSCCDLPQEMARQMELSIAPLSVELDGKSYADGIDMTPAELYSLLRDGKMPKTSAVNPDGWTAVMEPALKEGRDVLAIAFSSGLSTTYQSAVIAAEELREKYPKRKLLVVDSLCAALGQGLLVWYAAQKRAAGMGIEEVYNWVLENRLKVIHWVTVEDLNHLKRGGRVSTTTALVGTMLSIKPLIRVDDEGKLDTVGKIRGRKASLNTLVEKFREYAAKDCDTVFIGHGDCLEDAQYVEQQLKEQCGVKNVVIGYVGAVIGSHTGPGVVVPVFMGNKR